MLVLGKAQPYSTQVWNAIESVPWPEVLAIWERKLQEQIAHVFANSRFYQRKFGQTGLEAADIKSLKDLNRLPFTIKQELRDSLEEGRREGLPLGLHGGVDRRGVLQVQASSGTTGTPSYVGATARDIFVWAEMGARVFYANGFRPGDWCLHAYSMSRGFVGGLVNVQSLQYMGVCNIPMGAEAGTEKLIQVLDDLRPNAIAGTPNFMVYLGEKVREVLGVDARTLSIRRISVGGEPGGSIPAVRGRIEDLWGADCRDMMGGADFGSTYWAECEHKNGMHFCGQEFLLFEIIDPMTDESLPLEVGADGELVYTAIDRQSSALVRYRMGDRVRIVGTGACACGRTGPRILCYGRTDDMLIVRGINVFPSAVKDIVGTFHPETTGLMRLVVDFEGHTTQDALKLKVEYAAEVPADRLSSLTHEIEGRIKSKLSIPTDVALVPHDTLEKPGALKVKFIERVGG